MIKWWLSLNQINMNREVERERDGTINNPFSQCLPVPTDKNFSFNSRSTFFVFPLSFYLAFLSIMIPLPSCGISTAGVCTTPEQYSLRFCGLLTPCRQDAHVCLRCTYVHLPPPPPPHRRLYTCMSGFPPLRRSHTPH